MLTAVAFDPAIAITASADGVVSAITADIDRDGDLDVIAASADDNALRWYENNGAAVPSFTQHPISTEHDFSEDQRDRVLFAVDMDRDGDLDVVAASETDNTVAWHENVGGSGAAFTRHVISASVSGALAIHVDDVDGDGDPDVLVAAFAGDTISWFENDAAGTTFTERVIDSTADGAYSVFAADLDGDGDLDIVGGSSLDDTVTWYESNGAIDPSFTPHTVSTAADGLTSVYAGDIDGDGDVDLVSASLSDDKIAWYENNGAPDPAFAELVITLSADGAGSVTLADVDRDGDLDVISASNVDNQLAWYDNDGATDPAFTTRTVTTTADGINHVVVADIDGDGDPDLLSASENSNTVAWHRNLSQRRFSMFPTRNDVSTAADGVISSVAADIDGDGDPDVISASAADNTLRWQENDGANTPGFSPRTISTGQNFGASQSDRSVLAVDFDRDGDLDVVAASTDDNTVAWYENSTGDGTAFVRHDASTTAMAVTAIHVADVDRDGDPDILAAVSGDGRLVWFENNGDGTELTEHIIAAGREGASSVFAADFDGDGDMDVAAASSTDDTIVWYESDGAGVPEFTPHVVSTQADGASSVSAADVDADGDIDLLSASSLDNKVAWYENDGAADPAFVERVISTAMTGADSVTAADVNQDGSIDLVAAGHDNDTIVWYENSRAVDPTFTAHTVSTTADGAKHVAVADINRDGHPDILSASANNDSVAWYPNFSRTLSVADISVSEAAGTATFTIRLDGPASEPVSVNYATIPDTALAATDYTITTGRATIDIGSVSVTVTVPIVQDTTVELDERFFLDLSNPANANIAVARATGTITNDDLSRIRIDSVSIVEGDAAPKVMTFTVTLDNRVDVPVSINYATANDTAGNQTSGNDYQSASGTINFNGTGGETVTLDVVIVGDLNVEPHEDFLVNLSGLAAGGRNVVVADGEGRGTILNDDTSLSIDDVEVLESDGQLVFTITLAQPTVNTVTVDYATRNDTAVEPDDYLSTFGTATVPPGATTRTISVPIINDMDVESLRERFFIDLTNGQFTSISDATGVGTIVDDDRPRLEIEFTGDPEDPEVVVPEGAGMLRLTVTRTIISAGAVTVQYQTEGDFSGPPLATPDADYTSTNGTLMWGDGETAPKTIDIPILDDLLSEGDEVFRLSLRNPTGGAVLGDVDSIRIRILDDDLDFGDAPDTYGTRLLNNGARHLPVGPLLGATIDLETDAVAPLNGTGDDGSNTGAADDEDGIVDAVTALVEHRQSTPTVDAVVTNESGMDATLFGWIDYNSNGTFDAAERTSVNVPNGSVAATVTLTFPRIPPTAIVGLTYARFRISTDAATAGRPTGLAPDGEVEDYTFRILAEPSLSIDDVVLAEGDGTTPTAFLFTVSRSHINSDASVFVRTVNDTAIAGTDFTGIPATRIDFVAGGRLSQTIQVDVVADRVPEPDETFRVELFNAVGALLADATGVGTILNDDNAELVVSKTAVTVSEDGTTTVDSFTIALESPPSADVIVTVVPAPDPDVTVTPAGLTFTTLNWDQPQTVNVAGTDDDTSDGDELTIITVAIDALRSAIEYGAATAKTVTATTTDDDSPGISIDKSNVVVSEDGTTTIDLIAIRLNSEPSADVVVLLELDPNPEIMLEVSSLTFTSANWNQPQIVNVSGLNDPDDDGDEQTTITVSIDAANSAIEYAGVAAKTVAATTVDDETVGITLSASAVTVSEDGSTAVGAVDVRLSSRPTGDVVLNIGLSASPRIAIDVSDITFTSGNWDQPQTITVTGLDDRIAGGNSQSTISISVDVGNSAADYAGVTSSNIAATTTDDDTAAVTLNKSAVTVSEDGTSVVDAIAVVLTSEPAGVVVLAIDTGFDPAVEIDVTALTFTSANWDQPQSVNVTGINDAIDDADEQTPITIRIDPATTASEYQTLPAQTVIATTTDDDVAAFVVDHITLTVSEDGTSLVDSFSVVLSSEPTADVIFVIELGTDPDVAVTASALTFTNANWNQPQSMTVTGIDDTLTDADEQTTITIRIDGSVSAAGYANLPPQSIVATTINDDIDDFALNRTDVTVSEDGLTTDTFSVVLRSIPLGPVILLIEADDPTVADVDVTSLTFTSDTWNQPQVVTLTGRNDDVAGGDRQSSITVRVDAANSTEAYRTAADRTVTATVADDDSAGVVLSTSSVTVSEDGTSTTGSFSVVLSSEPTAAVVVHLTAPAERDAEIDASTLTFTPGDWNQPQTVNVTGLDDLVVDGDEQTEFTISVDATNSAAEYGGVAAQVIVVTTTNDDTVGFTLTPSDDLTQVDESGTTDTFTVQLNVQPVADVVLNVTFSDSSEASVVPTQLRFTPANWNEPQTVTVTGVNDRLVDGDQSTLITVSIDQAASDPAFQFATNQTITVITTDNDPEGSLDADGNGRFDPLSDGIVILRFMAGFTGAPLITGVVDTFGGTRTTAAQIVSFLQSMGNQLDIDGDDAVLPLSDGILIIRYLAGFTGDALIAGAVNTASGTRTSAAAITTYLDTLNVPAATLAGALPRAARAMVADSGTVDINDLATATSSAAAVTVQSDAVASRSQPDALSSARSSFDMDAIDLVFRQLADPADESDLLHALLF